MITSSCNCCNFDDLCAQKSSFWLLFQTTVIIVWRPLHTRTVILMTSSNKSNHFDGLCAQMSCRCNFFSKMFDSLGFSGDFVNGMKWSIILIAFSWKGRHVHNLLIKKSSFRQHLLAKIITLMACSWTRINFHYFFMNEP